MPPRKRTVVQPTPHKKYEIPQYHLPVAQKLDLVYEDIPPVSFHEPTRPHMTHKEQRLFGMDLLINAD